MSKFARCALTYMFTEMHIFTYRTRKGGVFKKRYYLIISAPTRTERAVSTENNLAPVLTTNCHLSRFAMIISRRATSAELSMRTSYSSH